MAMLESPPSVPLLAQALWITMHIRVPIEGIMVIATLFVSVASPEADASALTATFANWLAVTRDKRHPEAVRFKEEGNQLIGACAAARGITEEAAVLEWFKRELSEPSEFVPALQRELERLVSSEAWLFDRSLLSNSTALTEEVVQRDPS